jgi:hypothetical protein
MGIFKGFSNMNNKIFHIFKADSEMSRYEPAFYLRNTTEYARIMAVRFGVLPRLPRL